MTWEIALGIFALVSFVAVIIGWTSKIISALTKLNVSVDVLNETMKDYKNIQTALSERLGEHDVTLAEHGERIRSLEKKNGLDK